MFRTLLRSSRGSSHRERMGDPISLAGSDAEEELVQQARILARSGKAKEAADRYRQAAAGFVSSGRPVQAIAAAFEASWLDPRSSFNADEAVKVVRSVTPPVQRAEGQELIAELDSHAREALVWKLHPVSYGADELLAREGDPSEALWFVARGRIRATRFGHLGSRVTVGVVRPGAVVGESSVLAGGPRLATLVCEDPTDLLELRKSDLEALQAPCPALWRILERLQRNGDGRRGSSHVAA